MVRCGILLPMFIGICFATPANLWLDQGISFGLLVWNSQVIGHSTGPIKKLSMCFGCNIIGLVIKIRFLGHFILIEFAFFLDR